MPTRADYGDYPPDWKAISKRIRFERAAGRCECHGECGIHPGHRCTEKNGDKAQFANGKVVLTVAHLDHDSTNSDEMNLRAMCQRCHLAYDAPRKAEDLWQRKNAGNREMFPRRNNESV